MIKEISQDATGSMQKSIEVLKKEYASLRAGRATPALLDKITVDYYGTPTPVNQLANISVPEPRMLVIQPWDKGSMAAVEKAILKSDLGLTPSNDGSIIRLPIPALTEERRKELVKLIKKKAEETRVAVRNIRRVANDTLKKLHKDGDITEDEQRKGQDEIQKKTDQFIKEIDGILEKKEQEILQV